MRIYFEGSNTPQNPWKVHPYVEQRMATMEEYRLQMPFFTRLFRELNQAAEFGRGVEWLLRVLKVYYYPLGLLLASVFRERKGQTIRNLLIGLCRVRCGLLRRWWRRTWG